VFAGALRVHLAALAIVATVCSVASAYAARPSGKTEPATAPQAVRAATTLPARILTACGGSHPAAAPRTTGFARSLAAMVAPVRTVRLRSPLRQTPPLHAGGYVFPLAEAIPFADTFGAARSDVSWHHGVDLFAPQGTPVHAVARGVLFSVGWQRLGGRRLWFRDAAGNEFYYAHLDRYAPSARDGARVRAGEVIAFVGNSGDAESTPPHLHFEIHPASLLGLGYDGAVDPTAYLRSWARADAVVSARDGDRRHTCSAG
jgi:murein DD-endopeptidase MepM/ murein hydrolase activator NlpD